MITLFLLLATLVLIIAIIAILLTVGLVAWPILVLLVVGVIIDCTFLKRLFGKKEKKKTE